MERELAGRPALVLGASGFLGSNLVVALVAAGARVRACVRTPPATPDAELARALAASEVVQADLRDAAALEAIVPDEGVIFLAAGLSGAVASLARAAEDLDVNGRGVLNLLEAMRRRRSRARVVFPSTQLVYAPGTGPLDEDARIEPRSLYALHKLLGERYGEVYGHAHGLDWVTLRIANPYGPRQRSRGGAYGLVRHFLDRALADEDVPVYGDGAQRRGFLYVDDVTRAFLLAGSRPGAAGRIYNVGHPDPLPVRALAEAVVRACGSGRVTSVPWPDDAKRVEPGDACLDVTRAREELGWEPRVALDDGLARTVAWLRAETTRREETS